MKLLGLQPVLKPHAKVLYLIGIFLLLDDLEVLFMDATDGNSITSKVEDELAVAVYADDIAFASCKNAGVSAVPMSARISNNLGLEYDRHNFLLMHAMGPNVAGVIGSAVAAGALLGFFN